jgi:predicted site-specific integrase-resolvase
MRNLPREPIGAAEAARLLGVNVATVHRRIASGDLRGTKAPGGIRSPFILDRAEVVEIARREAAALTARAEAIEAAAS